MNFIVGDIVEYKSKDDERDKDTGLVIYVDDETAKIMWFDDVPAVYSYSIYGSAIKRFVVVS